MDLRVNKGASNPWAEQRSRDRGKLLARRLKGKLAAFRRGGARAPDATPQQTAGNVPAVADGGNPGKPPLAKAMISDEMIKKEQ
jgi:hypothetical protein